MVFAPHSMGGVRLCNLIHKQAAQQIIIYKNGNQQKSGPIKKANST